MALCECCKKQEGKEIWVFGEKMVLCPKCDWPTDDIEKADKQGEAGMALWAKLEAERQTNKGKVRKRIV